MFTEHYSVSTMRIFSIYFIFQFFKILRRMIRKSENKKIQPKRRVMTKPAMWFPNRFDTNRSRSVQSQKMVRSLEFWIL